MNEIIRGFLRTLAERDEVFVRLVAVRMRERKWLQARVKQEYDPFRKEK